MSIAVRQLQANYVNKVCEFYLNAVFDVHKNLISSDDMKMVLTDSKELFQKNYVDNKELKILIAVDEKDEVMGFSWSKNLDNPQDIIFHILVTSSATQNATRNALLEKIVNEFSGITNLYTDVYKRSFDDFEFYKNQGFEIYEESTAPAGKATMKVYLMKKST